MTQWEYKIVLVKDVAGKGLLGNVKPEAVEQHLNALGAEGWEVLTFSVAATSGLLDMLALAKRPKA